MKKLSLLLLFVLSLATVFSQGTQPQNLGGPNTRVHVAGQLQVDSGFRPPLQLPSLNRLQGMLWYHSVDSSYHFWTGVTEQILKAGGSGGSQNLQQTTALGNSTTIPIIDLNALKGDSIIGRNASLQGNIQLGDTILSTIPRYYGYGSSLTALGGGPSSTYSWFQLMGFDRQIITRDSAIGGTGISPNCPTNTALALIHRIGGFPHYNVDTAAEIFIEAGVNDVPGDSVAYKLALGQILDSLMIDYGFPAAHIHVISPFLSPSRLYDTVFIRLNAQQCAPRGIQSIDAWTPMAYAYYTLGLPVVGSDSLHPTQLGHKLEEMFTSNQFKFGKFKGNVSISGNTIILGSMTVNGPDTLNGKTFLPGGIWQSVTNSLSMHHGINTNGGDYSEESYMTSNPSVPDSIGIRFVAGSGNGSSWMVVHRKTTGIDTLLQAGGNNANITIGGGNPNTAYKLTVNGLVLINGLTNINGGINIVGDNVYRQFQYPYFNNGSGTVIYNGCVSNEIQFGNSYGRTDFGTYNGTVFTPNSGFNAGGTKFYVNRVTDDGTGAFLEVNGLFSTVGIANSAGVTGGASIATGNVTLSASNTDYISTNTGAVTYTLPALSTNVGRFYKIKNQGTNNITLVPAGADNMYDGSSITTLTIAPGSYVLVDGNSTTWSIFNGASSGGGLTNPMSAQQDMIYGGSGGAATRLAAPAHAGMHLVSGATVPIWADTAVSGASITTNPISGTAVTNGVDITSGVLTLHKVDATHGGVLISTGNTLPGETDFLGGSKFGNGTGGNTTFIEGSTGIHIGAAATQNVFINEAATTSTATIFLRTASQWNSSDFNLHGQIDLDGAIYFNSTSASTGGILHSVAGDTYNDQNTSTGGFYWRTNAGATNLMRLVGATGNLLLGTVTDITTSILTLTSTTKGVLLPRMTTTQVNAIGSPTEGTILYDNVLHSFYFNNGLSWISTNGSAYISKTANYTLTASDFLVNCTANSFTITLPTAVGIANKQYIVKNTGSSTTITIATTSSQTIDGSTPGTVTTLTPFRVMSDGANWITF